MYIIFNRLIVIGFVRKIIYLIFNNFYFDFCINNFIDVFFYINFLYIEFFFDFVFFMLKYNCFVFLNYRELGRCFIVGLFWK